MLRGVSKGYAALIRAQVDDDVGCILFVGHLFLRDAGPSTMRPTVGADLATHQRIVLVLAVATFAYIRPPIMYINDPTKTPHLFDIARSTHCHWQLCFQP